LWKKATSLVSVDCGRKQLVLCQ